MPENQPAKIEKPTPSEWIYIAGMVLIFIGLWICAGIGMALTVDGGVMVATAMINGWMSWRSDAI